MKSHQKICAAGRDRSAPAEKINPRCSFSNARCASIYPLLCRECDMTSREKKLALTWTAWSNAKIVVACDQLTNFRTELAIEIRD
jgi:hypothetical protein